MIIPPVMLAVLVGFAPSPAPTPPPPSALPEIGRVRAVTPACTALREVVLPAAQAARRADGRFIDVATRLPDYVRSLTDDPEGRTSSILKMKLARLDQTTSLIIDDAHAIAKLLQDPRLAPSSSDPLVRQEREALERLYEAQFTRVSNLAEFVSKQQVANGRAEIAALSPPTYTTAPRTPGPYESSAPRDLPLLTGIDVRDTRAMNEWTGQLTTMVRQEERDAAATLIPIASACE